MVSCCSSLIVALRLTGEFHDRRIESTGSRNLYEMSAIASIEDMPSPQQSAVIVCNQHTDCTRAPPCDEPLTTAVPGFRSASDFFRLTTSWLAEPKAACAGRFSPDIVATKSASDSGVLFERTNGARARSGIELELELKLRDERIPESCGKNNLPLGRRRSEWICVWQLEHLPLPAITASVVALSIRRFVYR